MLEKKRCKKSNIHQESSACVEDEALWSQHYECKCQKWSIASTTLQRRTRATQRILKERAQCREVKRTRATQKGDKSVRKKHGKYPSCIEGGRWKKGCQWATKKMLKKSGQYFGQHMWTWNEIVNGRSMIPS